jgi:hypothetical protein
MRKAVLDGARGRLTASLRLSTIVPIVLILTFANVSILWILNSRPPVPPPVDLCGAVALSNELSSTERLNTVYSSMFPAFFDRFPDFRQPTSQGASIFLRFFWFRFLDL